MAVRATPGMEFLDAVNLIRPKRRTSDAFVSGLSALTARPLGIVRPGRLDEIRRWWLGGVGRVLGKRGHLFGQLGHLSEKLGHLLFQLCDPSQIELFFGRFHLSTLLMTSQPLHLGLSSTLSDIRGPTLEVSQDFPCAGAGRAIPSHPPSVEGLDVHWRARCPVRQTSQARMGLNGYKLGMPIAGAAHLYGTVRRSSQQEIL